MGDLVNLNKARKARAKQAKAASAAANSARFGRSKARRDADAEDAARRDRLLDGARREE